MERIASGYALAEGPVATPDGGVIFSDALGGGVRRWSPATGAVETVIEKRRGIGGIAWHADGGLVVSGRDVSHFPATGEPRVLFADPEATGINDLTIDPAGTVIAGVMRHRPFGGEDPVPGEFVRTDGSVVLADVHWVNGCAFSPDGATFYACDYARGLVLTAQRTEAGAYAAPRVLVAVPGGQADGCAVAEDGSLWVALGSRGTVARLRPDGTLDSELEVPGASFVASLCFGGADRRDLFITTGGDPGAVYITRVPVAGVPVPAAID